jgi:hypothetical protein
MSPCGLFQIYYLYGIKKSVASESEARRRRNVQMDYTISRSTISKYCLTFIAQNVHVQ